VTGFDVPLTRREAVARQLREEILSGHLLPGTLLKDAGLAARLGMSITPVREAITQLAAEGLVDISPNRTRKVAGFTLKSALDLVDVMELLACAGFTAGAENLTDEHLRGCAPGTRSSLARSSGATRPMAQASGADFQHDRHPGRRQRRAADARRPGGPADHADAAAQLKTATCGHPWVAGYRDVLELLEQGNRAAAVARYRQIYPGYRAAVEARLLARGAVTGPGQALSLKPS